MKSKSVLILVFLSILGLSAEVFFHQIDSNANMKPFYETSTDGSVIVHFDSLRASEATSIEIIEWNWADVQECLKLWLYDDFSVVIGPGDTAYDAKNDQLYINENEAKHIPELRKAMILRIETVTGHTDFTNLCYQSIRGATEEYERDLILFNYNVSATLNAYTLSKSHKGKIK